MKAYKDSNSTIKILFLCHGNICRSTMAEFIFKDLVEKAGLSDVFVIDSAATSSEEIGSDVYPPARRKLEEKGVFCGHHRARRLTPEDYDKWDYIILMDEENLRGLKRIIPGDSKGKVSMLMSWAGEDSDVADPWYTGDFETTYRDVLKGCTALLARIC